MPADAAGSPPAPLAGLAGAPQAPVSLAPPPAPARFTGFTPTDGLSFNLATGQDANGVIQTSGDLADAHWTVSNADNYKQAPIAFTVAPGDADWFPGTGQNNPGWFANGPNSSWIAADPDNTNNGRVSYTITFDLTGYNPADALLQGGQFSIDDQGVVLLNGHQLGSVGGGGWTSFHSLSNGAGDFVAGVNTLVIETTASDDFLEAARFEGTVVDTVASNPPGPIHWASPVSGAFTNAADWVGGLVPASNNDAILDATGKKTYTVTASVSETVQSLQTTAKATLDVTGGTFTALTGTGSGGNGGTIDVADGASLSLAGEVVNSGLIALSGASAATVLSLTGDTTLSGGGQVTLGGAEAAIVGGATAETFANTDNTIAGAGAIGSPTLTFDNGAAGVVNAEGATALTITAATTNAGLIEATGAGGLIVDAVTIDNSAGGVLLAGAGSRVVLDDATVEGGEIESTGSGLVRVLGRSNVLDGTTSALANAASIRIAKHGQLILEGAIDNSGRISVRDFSPAGLVIGAAGVTLSGGGSVTLVGGAVIGASASATLTNDGDIIRGDGALGAGAMSLVNEAAGVIDGDNAAGLTINTGGDTVINAGLMEATAGGSLAIESALDNTGTLRAIGGGTLTLFDPVTGSGGARIDGGTLVAAGTFSENVAFNKQVGLLELAQSQGYGGTVSGFSRTSASTLDLRDIGFVSADEASWSGGVLTVTDGTHTARITLAGDYAKQTFVASDDGHGGTLVVATTPGAFAAAMAAAAPAAAHAEVRTAAPTVDATRLASPPTH